MAKVSLVPQILDALVSGLRAYTGGTVTFRAPDGSADGVTVYDGPEWLVGTRRDADGFVVIGYGGEDLEARPADASGSSGSGSTSVRAISTESLKDHEDEFDCVAVATDSTPSAARLAAHAMADALDSFLRTDPTLGIATSADGQVFHVQVTERPELRQWVSDQFWCALVVTLTAKTRT